MSHEINRRFGPAVLGSFKLEIIQVTFDEVEADTIDPTMSNPIAAFMVGQSSLNISQGIEINGNGNINLTPLTTGVCVVVIIGF